MSRSAMSGHSDFVGPLASGPIAWDIAVCRTTKGSYQIVNVHSVMINQSIVSDYAGGGIFGIHFAFDAASIADEKWVRKIPTSVGRPYDSSSVTSWWCCWKFPVSIT